MLVPDDSSALESRRRHLPAQLPSLSYDEWREAVCSAFVPHETQLAPGVEFQGHLGTSHLGALMLADVGGSPVQVVRTQRAIRSADPDLVKVGVQMWGHSVLTQDGRVATLAPGDLAVYDTRRPYRLSFERDFSMLVLMLPRDLMSIRARQLSDVTARRISGSHGMGAVLSPFLALLAARSLSGDVQPSIEVCDAVLDLLAATCRSESEQVEDSQPAAGRRAHLFRIQTYIEEHLGDPTLDTVSIAEAHHVSARYLQKLFQENGETLRSWIRTRRLDRCQRELADRRLRQVPVSAIGSRWGFYDAANFVRAFRTEFGTTPSAWRDAALQAGSQARP
jgi:AraC-like DNA-binding protein